jgi:hypothetical protein
LRPIAWRLTGALVATIALSLVAPVRAFGQTDTSGLITGTIRDLSTRQPLSSVPVSLYDVNHEFVQSTSTDPTGVFRFGLPTGSALPAGTYYVLAEGVTGFAGQAYSGVACFLSCRMKDATPIHVTVGKVSGGIDFLLAPNGSIAGRVINATSGAGVAGANVAAGTSAGLWGGGATTAADGTFTISVAPGAYLVSVYPPANTPLLAAPQSAMVTSGLTTTIILWLTQAPPPTGSIAGRITVGGQPPSATASISASGTGYGRVQPDAAGNYVIAGLPPGRYFVTGTVGPADYQYSAIPCLFCPASLVAPVVVPSAAPVTGVDFNLPATGTITGTITTSSGPLPTVSVSAYYGQALVGSATVTNGAYSLTGLPPGAYVVSASTDTGLLSTRYPSAVTVRPGAITSGIDLQLDNPATNTGAITGTIHMTGSQGDGYLFVEARHADGTVANSTLSEGGDGFVYTISGLPAGSYYVVAGTRPVYMMGFVSGGNYPTVVYDAVPCDAEPCSLSGGKPVGVSAGETISGIDFTLEPGAWIQGRVTDEGATVVRVDRGLPPSSSTSTFEPLIGVPFLGFSPPVAYTLDGRRAGISTASNGWRFGIAVGLDTYQISGLHAGTYFVEARVAGFAPMIYKGLICATCLPRDGTPVTLSSGEARSGIDFVLLPGTGGTGSITGKVTDTGSGTSLAGVGVVLYSETGALTSSSVLTDTSGAYQFSGLAAGRYYLATSNAYGYVDVVYDGVACGSCDPRRGKPVDVAAGPTTTSIDFHLTKGMVIGGEIRDAVSGGDPATVSIFDASGTPVARVQSSFSGGYAAAVPAGISYARLEPRGSLSGQLYNNMSCPGGACSPTSGTPIAGSVGQIITNVDFWASACGSVSLLPAILPAANINVAYSSSITATPGGPFTFAVVSGSLPDGVSLGPTGALTGTPTARGSYSFTVSAADASGCGGSIVTRLDVIGCTPSLPATIAGAVIFDVAGSGGVVDEPLDATCPSAITFNVPWLQKGGDRGPGTLEILVAPNAAGPRSGSVTIGNRSVSVNQGASVGQPPFGSLDVPVNGTVVSGAIAIGGWVLDDLRATSVSIYRNAVSGEPGTQVFIGNATLVPGARPDIEQAFPEYPYANRAGWGYMLLTNMLPSNGNGAFTLTAIAQDVEGNQSVLGTSTIIANNAAATRPFGTIDTPGQGDTISGGTYVNFGWALTPKPKSIPTDGSTIVVFIDGMPLGTVNYNNFRSDIASAFPDFNNSNGAVGYRTINTLLLADGIHTISWAVTDTGSVTEGIGSRYFTVSNGSSLFASERAPASVAPGRESSVRAVTPAYEYVTHELDRIEIPLVTNNEPASCRVVFSGVERVGTTERPLPVGSSLDRVGGRFVWHPGPGFIGTYRLSFDVGQCDGTIRHVDVNVTIRRRQE